MPATTINGFQMHFEQSGAGEDLLFIHGLGSSGADWERQVAHFSASFRVTTMDLRGFGQSERPPARTSVELMARDVLALMDHLGIAQAHVVGLSMGGMVSQWLAVQAPERVRSLVLVGTCARLKVLNVSHALLVAWRAVTFPFMSMGQIARIVATEMFPDPDQTGIWQQCVERFSRNDVHTFRKTGRAILFTYDVRRHLPSLRVPTLIVVGDEDPIVPLVHSKEMHRLIPGSEYVVLTMSRHACPIDSSDRFNRLAHDFLERVQRRHPVAA